MKAMSPSTADLSATHGGYHSPADADRMHALVRALLEGRRPIALSGVDSQTLEHYSRLLVRDLRQHESVRINAPAPGGIDALLQQVSDLVTDISLDHVVDRDAALARPIHVFVVHDSPALTNAELSLLVRLANDLPGANLRVALIQARDDGITGHLAALGSQALHWRIGGGATGKAGAGARADEPPSQGALKQALKEAMLESPDTLPPWARLADDKGRRRWRLAFWRRHPDAAVATARASGRPQPRAAGKAAARPAAPTKAAKATKTTSANTNATKGARAAKAAVPARATESPAARRNRVVLVAGIFLSAALAGALGTWLQMHQPAPRAAGKPATPVTATTATTANAGMASLQAR